MTKMLVKLLKNQPKIHHKTPLPHRKLYDCVCVHSFVALFILCYFYVIKCPNVSFGDDNKTNRKEQLNKIFRLRKIGVLLNVYLMLKIFRSKMTTNLLIMCSIKKSVHVSVKFVVVRFWHNLTTNDVGTIHRLGVKKRDSVHS